MTTPENHAASAERIRLNAAFAAAVRNWNGHGPKEKTLLDVINNGEALYFAAHALITHLEGDEKHRAPYCYDHCMAAAACMKGELQSLQAELQAARAALQNIEGQK